MSLSKDHRSRKSSKLHAWHFKGIDKMAIHSEHMRTCHNETHYYVYYTTKFLNTKCKKICKYSETKMFTQKTKISNEWTQNKMKYGKIS